MAEGYTRHAHSDRYRVFSAGTERTHVRPLAIQAMNELGIDISGHTSKTLDDLADVEKDYVITVCDSAREACPVVTAREAVLHESFPDPSAATGSEEERLEQFRSVRDALIRWIDRTFSGKTPAVPSDPA
jgi:arsenate reductase